MSNSCYTSLRGDMYIIYLFKLWNNTKTLKLYRGIPNKRFKPLSLPQPHFPSHKFQSLRGLAWRWNGVYMYSTFRQVSFSSKKYFSSKKKALKLFQGSFIRIIIRTTPFFFFSEVHLLNTYLTLFDSRLACHNTNTDWMQEPPRKCTMKAWLANAYYSTTLWQTPFKVLPMY